MCAWFHPLLDLLLPAYCPSCRHARGPGFCTACVEECARIAHPCERCAAPREHPDDPCQHCHGRGITHLSTVHATFSYTGLLANCITRAKSHGDAALVGGLTELLHAPQLNADAVCVIPPSPGRTHGPHLASALARELAAQLSLPFQKLLRIARPAAAQHALTHADRQRNVQALFTAKSAPPSCILVDDLLTSGATATAAAGCLLTAGASRVHLVTLARTPSLSERISQAGEPKSLTDNDLFAGL